MEQEQDKFCMLCCVSYKYKQKNELASLGTAIRFKKFCRDLECVLKEKGTRAAGGKTALQKLKLKGDLNLAYDNLSICTDCLKLICNAVDGKDKAKKVEIEVNDLQREILRLMEELDGYMGTFLERMRKIEKVIKDSDESALVQYLDENLDPELGKDAHGFRQTILDAVTDLKFFRKDLSDKVGYDLYQEGLKRKKEIRAQQRLEERLKTLVDRQTQTSIRGDIVPRRMQMWGKLNVKNKGQQTTPVYFADSETPVDIKVEIEPADSPDQNVDFFENDVYHPQLESGDNDNDNMDDMDDCPSLSKRPRRAAVRRKRVTPPSPIKKENEDEDDGDAINFSDADSNFSDVDLELQELRSKEIRNAAKNDADAEFAHLSKLKRKMVSFVLQKFGTAPTAIAGNTEKEPESEADTPEANNIENPLDIYKIRYVPANETLMLDNIEIVLDESEECVKCSVCSHMVALADKRSTKPQAGLIMKMYDHILADHLGGYTCKICSSRLKRLHLYLPHVRGHSQPCICDICGKPFLSEKSVRSHKWLHMSEDEKADAIQRGMTNPFDVRLKVKNRPKIHPCTTCGKLFNSIPAVRVHEQTHDERVKVPCHLCGKLLLNTASSIDSHEKYACPAIERRNEALECNVCHKMFKNKPSLQRHKTSAHPQKEMPMYPCNQCGKSFKAKNNLKNHMDIHAEIPAYNCSKCGTGFKQKRNMTRHEGTCKGTSNRRQNVVKEKRNSTSGEDADTLSVGHSSYSTQEEESLEEPLTAGNYLYNQQDMFNQFFTQ